jgi:hypothetical protein
MERPALRNHIPHMVHVILLAIDGPMSSVSVERRTKSSEVLECSAVWREWIIANGKRQTLRNKGDTRINKVSAMRPGLVKLMKKVRLAGYFESPDSDVHITENACCVTYDDNWSPKLVHWTSKSQSQPRSTSDYGCTDTLELYSRVAQAGLLITGIQTRVAWKPKYSELRPLFTALDEWTIVKKVMELFRTFRYWTLWMSKRHTISLRHVNTVYNDIFDQKHGAMWAVGKKNMQWNEDFIFAGNLARQQLSKYYAEVSPTTGMLLISADIFDPSHKFVIL